MFKAAQRTWRLCQWPQHISEELCSCGVRVQTASILPSLSTVLAQLEPPVPATTQPHRSFQILCSRGSRHIISKVRSDRSASQRHATRVGCENELQALLRRLSQTNENENEKPELATAADGAGASSSGAPEEDPVIQAFERLIMEAYRLLHEGKTREAEYLLQEAASNMEEALGPEAAPVAQLWDQLALMQFFQEKLEEALESSQKSLGITQRQYGGGSAAVAMCHLRMGAVLTALQRGAEAQPLLRGAYDALVHAFGEDYEAAGEARYYLALCRLLPATRAEQVSGLEAPLAQGLKAMQGNAGAGHLLVQAALREHNRLIDSAMEGQDWGLAEALFEQEIRLQRGCEPLGSGLALLTYQYATLQYVRGRHAQAEGLAQQSLELACKLYPAQHEELLLRHHRLGTVQAALGKLEEAEAALEGSHEGFQQKLGADNPVTGEALFALSLVRWRGLLPFQKVQQEACLQGMLGGINAMVQGFGRDHMLVQKAFAEAESALGTPLELQPA